MFALNLLRCQAVKQLKKPNSMRIHKIAKREFKDGGEHPTFNDMPIPQGCWYENHARQQRRYNIVLLSGIVSFVLSVLFVAKSGKMVMNYSVPDYPYDEENK